MYNFKAVQMPVGHLHGSYESNPPLGSVETRTHLRQINPASQLQQSSGFSLRCSELEQSWQRWKERTSHLCSSPVIRVEQMAGGVVGWGGAWGGPR